MKDQSRCLEDYKVGQEGRTATRTITEADIASFAYLTEDYSTPHMDRHAMENSVYGARVAHGLLGSSVATGMLSLHAPHILGRGVPGAYLCGFEANYRWGLKVTDTVHVQWRIAENVISPTHEGFGLVTTAFKVVTHEGTAIYDGTVSTLVRKDPASGAELRLRPGTPWHADDDPEHAVEETEGRTITETDVVNFAGLTGDFDPRYVDAEFAKGDIFGERIAHSMLVFTAAFGRWTTSRSISVGSAPPPPPTPVVTGPAVDKSPTIAGHLNDTASFLAPVRIGDTIRCRSKVLATRASKSRPGFTVTTTGLQVVNQRNEVVQDGSTVMLG